MNARRPALERLPRAIGRMVSSRWAHILLIVSAAAVVYSIALRGPFIHVDLIKIVNNPDIRRLGNLATKLVYPYDADAERAYFRNDPSRPLVYLTYTLDYAVWKHSPFGYRLFNLLCHAGNALLVYALLTRLLGFLFPGGRVAAAAFFGALVFAVHAANTYTVSYIFRRSDLLATFFYLAAILFFLRSRAAQGRAAVREYLLSLAGFLLALLSKQSAVTLPAAVLLVDYVIVSNSSWRAVWSRAGRHAGYWVLGAAYVALRYWYLGGIGDLEAQSTLDGYEYRLMQPHSIMHYLQLLIMPTGFCFFHDIEFSRVAPLAHLVPIILLATLVIVLILLFLFGRLQQLEYRTFFFAALWFLITVSPASSIFPTTTFMVQNRLYLPSVGFVFFLAVGGKFLYRQSRSRGRYALLGLFILGTVYVWGQAVFALRANVLFANPDLLWKGVIERYPHFYLPYNQLGSWYARSGRFDECEQWFAQAIRSSPHNIVGHVNLGTVYLRQGRREQALRSLQRAVLIDPTASSPQYVLGLLHESSGDLPAALAAFERSRTLNPRFSETYVHLAIVSSRLGRSAAANEYLRAAVQLNPDVVARS